MQGDVKLEFNNFDGQRCFLHFREDGKLEDVSGRTCWLWRASGGKIQWVKVDDQGRFLPFGGDFAWIDFEDAIQQLYVVAIASIITSDASVGPAEWEPASQVT